MIYKLWFLTFAAVGMSAAVLPIVNSHPQSIEDIPLSTIFERINISSPLTWTYDVLGNITVRSTYVDPNKWDSAVAAIAVSIADGSFPDRPYLGANRLQDLIDQTSSVADNIHLEAECYDTGFLVFKDDLYANVPNILDRMRTNGGPGSYQWAYNHVLLPDVTLWYYADIKTWDDEVNVNLLREMYHYLIKYRWCGTAVGKMKGGLVKGRDIHSREVLVQIEAIAEQTAGG